MNVGNLLNKKWGLIDDYGFTDPSRCQLRRYRSGHRQVRYFFTGSTDNPSVQENNNDKGNTAVSRWSMQLTLKYKF